MSAAGRAVSRWLTPEVAEFRPGLLAIQQSPPPKLPRAVFFVVASSLPPCSPGRCWRSSTSSRSPKGGSCPRATKILQPAEAGIVKEVLVSEGQSVKEGQVLIRLDPTLAGADDLSLGSELAAKRLALRRIDAELRGAPLLPRVGRRRRTAGAGADAGAYPPSGLPGRAGSGTGLARACAAGPEGRTGDSCQAALDVCAGAAERRSASASRCGGLLQRPFLQREGTRSDRAGAGPEGADCSGAGLAVDPHRAGKEDLGVVQQLPQPVADRAHRGNGPLARLEQDSRKVKFKAGLLELRAPKAGTVKDIATTTLGAIVQPGMVLLTLVPRDEPLVAEVQVRNDDVGFVRVGQPVKLKIAAYPFQKHGLLEGRVRTVAADAQTGDSVTHQATGAGLQGGGGAGKSGPAISEGTRDCGSNQGCRSRRRFSRGSGRSWNIC